MQSGCISVFSLSLRGAEALLALSAIETASHVDVVSARAVQSRRAASREDAMKSSILAAVLAALALAFGFAGSPTPALGAPPAPRRRPNRRGGKLRRRGTDR